MRVPILLMVITLLVMTLAFIARGESEGVEADHVEVRLVSAILKSRSIKQADGSRKPYWQECGKKLAKDEMEARAEEWVDAFLEARERTRKKYGLELPLWGTFTTMENESGFNMCTLDKESREWAYENGVVKRLQFTYSKEDVWKIVSHRSFKSSNRKADIGPMQVRFGHRKIDKDMINDWLTLVPGIENGTNEMARRAIWYKNQYKTKNNIERPWRLWPSLNPRSKVSTRYDSLISRKARWLGAKPGEI